MMPMPAMGDVTDVQVRGARWVKCDRIRWGGVRWCVLMRCDDVMWYEVVSDVCLLVYLCHVVV